MMSWAGQLDAQRSEWEAGGRSRALCTLRQDGLYLCCGDKRYLNFSSNDYLGLSTLRYDGLDLPAYYRREFGGQSLSPFSHGTPASRLMTGNCPEYDVLEGELAALFPGKQALVLSSGYMVNSGLLPALAQEGDVVLADRLVHASIIEGMRTLPFRRFRHNDMQHLQDMLSRMMHPEKAWVVVESVYSMDGDRADLRELAKLRRKYGFRLYVDEAHSFGVYGAHGAGLCMEEGIVDEVDILVCTFGKALAGAGACVLCAPVVRQYLVNTLRPLIYSTALPPCTLQWVGMVVHEMRGRTMTDSVPDVAAQRAKLAKLVQHASDITGQTNGTQIIPVVVGSDTRALEIAQVGRDARIWLTAIRPPTVPEGSARIRISLHAELKVEQLYQVFTICSKVG